MADTDKPRVAADIEFSEAEQAAFAGPEERLSLSDLEDVNVCVEANLGQAIMQVRDVIRLNVGSIVVLDKAAGDTADICVNRVPLGQGEVIVSGDNLQLRLLDVGRLKREREDHEIA